MAHATPGTCFPPNHVYSATMLDAFGRPKAAGIAAVVFGDIVLEDLRAYRDRLLAHVGLEGRSPLRGRDPGELYDRFVALGFEAITVCVERGEYHSFASDGPPSRRPVRFILGDVHRHAPFASRGLDPVATEPPSQFRP